MRPSLRVFTVFIDFKLLSKTTLKRGHKSIEMRSKNGSRTGIRLRCIIKRWRWVTYVQNMNW